MPSRWKDFREDGFDPEDGLDEDCGRWMRDTWGVVRWVQTQEPVSKKKRRAA